jgi:hypothetical protein
MKKPKVKEKFVSLAYLSDVDPVGDDPDQNGWRCYEGRQEAFEVLKKKFPSLVKRET